jgi:hypothetical protein
MCAIDADIIHGSGPSLARYAPGPQVALVMFLRQQNHFLKLIELDCKAKNTHP